MFKRGSGPLVSVLIPTRGRRQWLFEAVDSVHSLAKDPSLIEYIFKVDCDDTEAIEAACKLSTVLPCKTLLSVRGNGYHDMHHWVNDMSRLALGDWIFLFNDDARMKTPDWDQILLNVEIRSTIWHGNDDVCLLIAPTIDRPGCTEFFFLRRKVVDVLGHLSLSPHNDHWIYTVTAAAQSAFHVPIDIEHLSGVATDLTRQESKLAYETTLPTFLSREAIVNKSTDIVKLIEHIGYSRRS